MNERYTRLFSTPKNLYTSGAPVVIIAGALLKDNELGRVLGQLKFKNIDIAIIIALTVQLTTFDSAGRAFTEKITFSYLDLYAERDSEFGQKTAIPINNPSVRSFQVAVTEVVFADKSIWQSTTTEWQSLNILTSLMTHLHDKELVKQYQLHFGADYDYYPSLDGEIWTCACGAFNHIFEPNCHVCKRSYQELTSFSLDQLISQKDKRVTAEKQKIASMAKKEKVKRYMIAFCCLIIALAIAIGICRPASFIKYNEKYDKAVSILSKDHFNKEALSTLVDLKGYKNSEEIANYIFGLWAAADHKYFIAKGFFEMAGDYSNAQELKLQVEQKMAEKSSTSNYEAILAKNNIESMLENKFSDCVAIDYEIKDNKFSIWVIVNNLDFMEVGYIGYSDFDDYIHGDTHNKRYVLHDVENTCVTALEVSKECQNLFADNGYPEMECYIDVGIYSIGVGTNYIYYVSNGVETKSYFNLSDLQEYHD